MSMTGPMAYAASRPGMPGFSGVIVDDPKMRADVADLVRDWILDGAQVRRVTIDEARTGLAAYLAHRELEQQRAAEVKPPPRGQGDLFGSAS